MNTKRRGIAIIIVALSAGVGLADRFVATNGLNQSGYSNWVDAATNIQTAIDAASAGETVWVSNGTYMLTNQVVISNALTVRSYNAGAQDRTNTIINGNYPIMTNRCVYLNHAQAVLQGFMITNGATDSFYGGGVFVSNGVVENCLILGNRVLNIAQAYGGGVYMANGLVSNCVVQGNSTPLVGSAYGSGIYAVSNAVIANTHILSNKTYSGGGGFFIANNVVMRNCLIAGNSNTLDVIGAVNGGGGGYMKNNSIMEDCVVSNNTSAGAGGGILMGIGNPTVRRCMITTNTCGQLWQGGGGIYIYDGGLVEDCQIINNRAPGTDCEGGGISFSYDGKNVVRNCLVAFNTSGYGGGMATYHTFPVIANCTIASNTATGQAGGLHIRGAAGYTSLVYNCIIYYNTAVSYQNYRMEATVLPDPVVSNSCSTPTLGSYGLNNITNDPQFISRATGDFRLQASSPCINQGLNQNWMTLDLDGRSRIDRFSRIVDMGAYEFLPTGSLFLSR